MSILGASGFAVSFVAGFGELLGYGLRVVSGYLTDKTKRHWTIAMVGYSINLASVPLMGFVSSWQAVAVLMFTERIGKAIRSPARDTIISFAARNTGTGMGYGIHEALDRIGAFTGPVLISLFFYFNFGYRASFLLLAIPALIALSVLVSAQQNFPEPEVLEPAKKSAGYEKIRLPLWIYIVAVSFVGMGFSDFPLIAYHVKKNAILPDGYIPLLYSLTMAVDAAAALFFGRMFDRIGILAVVVGVGFSATFSYFAFLGGISGVIIGVALWGIGMGVQESIMKAAIANVMHASVRGRAFGIFNATYGVFSFVGSLIMGLLYDKAVIYLVYFSIVSHVLAFLMLLFISGKRFRAR
jgi:MFS family permease